MKLLSFETAGSAHAGVVRADGMVVDLTVLAARASEPLPASVLGWIEAGPAEWDRMRALVDQAGPDADAGHVSSLALLAPIPRLPRNVICVGANYRDHIDESERVVGALELPEDPVYFTKDVRSICGPYDDIDVAAGETTQLDWEVELAVVIGRPGRRIAVADALDHVFGYAVLNDVSARDVQLGRKQWWKGKSLQGSSPFGPYIVTADDVPDPSELLLSCSVDQVEKQRCRAALMIHDIAHLIADLSNTLTLEPGDVISTGTPSGVGMAQEPQQWLVPGSVLESEISGLGRQRNEILSKEH